MTSSVELALGALVLWLSTVLDVTFSFLLTPQTPSSLPTELPRTPPRITVLVSSSPLPSPSPPFALILINLTLRTSTFPPCPLS